MPPFFAIAMAILTRTVLDSRKRAGRAVASPPSLPPLRLVWSAPARQQP